MKLFIKLILGSIGLVIVAAVAAVIMVATLDPNEHKDWIAEKVEERTGRSFHLDGDIAISYYPWLGLEARKVALGNAQGFDGDTMFRAEYLKLRIKLMPLLRDQYEIDTVSVHGLALNLARNSEGRTNWDDLVSAEKDDDAAAFPVAAVVLGGVDIQDAELKWVDLQNDKDYLLSKINISTDALVYGEPIKLQLDMNARSKTPAIDSTVRLDGTIAYDIDTQRYDLNPLALEAVLRSENIPGGETTAKFNAAIALDLDEDTADISALELDALGTRIRGSFQAAKIQTPEPAVRATIEVEGDDIARLFKVAEIEPLATQLASLAQRSFTLITRFDADMERGDVDVPELDLNMLGATVKGDIKGRNVLSETPGFQGQLNARGPDLPTLLQVIGQVQGGKKSPLVSYGKQLGRLKGKAFIIDADFDADLKSGDIKVPALNIDTLGLKLAANLNARDMQSSKGHVDGRISFSADELGALLRAVDQKAVADMLHSLELETAISGNADDVTFKGLSVKARVAAEQVGKKSLPLALTADTRLNLPKQTLVMKGLSVQGLGLDVKGNINARQIMKAPEVSGDIDIASFNPRSLLKQIGKDVPKTASKKVLRSAALKTRFQSSDKAIKLDELILSLDQTKVMGDLSLGKGDTPAYAFDLNIDRLNLDDYLPPAEKNKNKKPVTPETAAGAAVQLPVETLRGLNVRGKLAVGSLVISNAKLSNVKLGIDGKDGKINLKPITASLYQGTYSGDISINAKGKLPKLVINSAIKGVEIEPLLKDYTGEEAMLVGRSNISIAAVARGNDTDMFKKTLNGQAELRVTNGVVRGVDINSALEQVEIMIESKRFGKVNTEGNTPFNSLTGTLPINRGIVTNEDLLLTAPGFQVTGTGMLANLRNMTWKYDLLVSVVERSVARNEQTYNIGDYNIPIKCRGELTGENCKPDISGLAAVAAKKIILDKLTMPGTGAETGAGKAVDDTVDPGKELLDKALKSIFD